MTDDASEDSERKQAHQSKLEGGEIVTDSDLEKAQKSVLNGGERVSKGGQRGRDTDDE
ncbi:hypothetical protein [Halococcoides cellulosivorans]|uniref:hypothetical protein n=1 Tax=Halococcoides cellulosivorans TaxID=1679096 RepID=UPI00131F116A|nr:hypothetical protein [Halococcoides cellulosivorans]